jgi:hypothetical protein
MHLLIEVTANFGSRRQFEMTTVRSGGIDPVTTQRHRIDSIKDGRAVQPDEGISVIPMATRPMTTVHKHHRGVAFAQHGICEGQGGGPGTDDDIISFDDMIFHVDSPKVGWAVSHPEVWQMTVRVEMTLPYGNIARNVITGKPVQYVFSRLRK